LEASAAGWSAVIEKQPKSLKGSDGQTIWSEAERSITIRVINLTIGKKKQTVFQNS
jgi:hypothetical protein